MTSAAEHMITFLGRRLAEPAAPSPDEPWIVQSLAKGTAGTALFHCEAARTHAQPWRTAHRWITAATAGPINAADTSGLFLGAPAIGFLLSTVPDEFSSLYAHARRSVHLGVVTLAHRRVDAALARMRRCELATFAEYDIFYGLTGIGAYLLRTDPGNDALAAVLDYLVALTHPLARGDRDLPGWWVGHDPSKGYSPNFPGGHGNLGAAHGVTVI